MMDVRKAAHFGSRWAGAQVWCAAVVLAFAAGVAHPQMGNPSSGQNPFYGSVTLRPATDEVLQLSLDEAVRRGLENNLGLREAESGEKVIQGEKNEALQLFLPTITVSGGTGVFQHDLAAQGFSSGAVGQFAKLLGMSRAAGFNPITKDDLTQGQINYSQILFSGPVISGWRGAKAAEKAAHFAKMSARGEVVQQVATAYLHAIAAASEVDQAKALQQADQLQFDQTHAAHEAGTVANLDELRARVQLQAQEQAVIAAQNDFDRDLILLKREIGVDPGQKMVLTDQAPYSELAEETPEEVRAVAYKNRQDYQNLQNQMVEVRAIHEVYKGQRLPVLTFGGYYGVNKVNGTPSHGDFAALGTLSLPIFNEAKIRGDEQSSAAQLDSVRAQLEDLRSHIDQQVRSALLDVHASHLLVEVGQSNVDLATRELSDETERVNAGVDDNLPLVTAQATLASAQSNLIESRYQYNLSKLMLARAAGVLEQQYRVYLGR
jgi:outer membrane protein TolC